MPAPTQAGKPAKPRPTRQARAGNGHAPAAKRGKTTAAYAPVMSRSAVHKPLRLPKAGEVLAAQLRLKIVRGELKEGDRLPTESRLIEQYKVSRATVREAILLLVSEGLISVGRGTRTGALVHYPDIRAASQHVNLIMQLNNVTLDDVYRSLGAFEPAVVRELAEKCTKADLKVLRERLDDMRAVMEDDHAWGEAIAGFHRALAERSGLRTMAIMMELLVDLVGAYVESASASQPIKTNLAGKMKSIRVRERLLELLEKRQVEAVEALWRQHFLASGEVMLRCLPAKSVQDIRFSFYDSSQAGRRR
jgi:DNA-binding FadR family transcriptional regulator